MHYTSLCLAFGFVLLLWVSKLIVSNLQVLLTVVAGAPISSKNLFQFKRDHIETATWSSWGNKLFNHNPFLSFFLSKSVTYKKRKNRIKPYYFELMTLLFITPSPTILRLCSTDQNLKSKHYSKKCKQNFSQLPAKCHWNLVSLKLTSPTLILPNLLNP